MGIVGEEESRNDSHQVKGEVRNLEENPRGICELGYTRTRRDLSDQSELSELSELSEQKWTETFKKPPKGSPKGGFLKQTM